MLMLRAATARASPAASTMAAAAAAAVRRSPSRLITIAGFSSSSGGKRGKGRRPKPPPPQPQPQSQPQNGDAPRKKKPNARPRPPPPTPVAVEAAEVSRRPEGEGRKKQPQQQLLQEKPKRVVKWKCASGCGACCKLDKGPDFPTPEEIFADHTDHLQLYKSMIGDDGWCTNYDKSTRTCNIYEDRPFFCRVEPKVFDEFFGVPQSRFDREACSACADNIKMVYGEDSGELTNFKRVIREESSKHEASMNQDKLLDS